MTDSPALDRPRRWLLLCLLPLAAGAAAEPRYVDRDEVRQFVAEMHQRHGFEPAPLLHLFARVKPQAAAIKAIMPPKDPGVRSWHAYRSRYVEPRRIEWGLGFWQEHRAALEAAQREYGVPEEIIVAIIGVETIYGRHMGRFPVLDTLTTLAFDYPPRAELFRRELEAFLLLARETGADPRQARGSYAGAMGLPQFLPSSIRRYAVDFDGDKRIDLRASPDDAIGSVARFLKEHGWEKDGIVAVPANIADERHGTVVDGDVRPRFSLPELSAYGVYPAEPLPIDALCAVIDLVTPNRPTEYWLGLNNFYVITRYNRSSFYAMAVYELARELRAVRQTHELAGNNAGAER
ncbi:MAG: lytic murein transglycosylase B [Pseudomonadota bacterium]